MLLAPRNSSVLGWKVPYKETLPGAHLAPGRSQPQETRRFGKRTVLPIPATPKHKPAGAAPAHRSRSWLRPLSFLLPPPPPGTPYFHATGDQGAGREPPPGPLHPPARCCRSSTPSILRAPSIAATPARVNAAAAARGGACSAHRARGSAPSPRPAGAEP